MTKQQKLKAALEAYEQQVEAIENEYENDADPV